MSKQSTKGKLKIKDFLYNPLIVFLCAQVVILVLFFAAYHTEVPLKLSDCASDSIIVDDKYTISLHNRNMGKLHIISNGKTYIFSDSNYETKELYNKISIGEKIDICYVEGYSILSGKHFWVVDAKTDIDVYADIDSYNNSCATTNIITIIAFSLFEIVFLALAVFFAPFNLHDVKEKINTFIDKYRKAKQTKQK